MATRITMSNVLPLLRAAVETRGEDYNYRSEHDTCVYSLGGQPSCLVGVVLHSAGVNLASLKNLVTVEGLYEEGDLTDAEISPEAVVVLSAAQKKQDVGKTWIEAYAAAVAAHVSAA